MEHSGTESDKAVPNPPDVVPATSTTTPSTSPPDAIPSDHEATGDTTGDVVDTPAVTTQQTQEPGEIFINPS